MSPFLQVITASDREIRDTSLDSLCAGLGAEELLDACRELDEFRRHCDNLYERVRALFFLYAIHRFHLPDRLRGREAGHIPFVGHAQMLERRYQEAIDTFLTVQQSGGPTITLSSALAAAFHRLAFQTLADQVRRSVRTVRGNQWMFRSGHPADAPLQLRSELQQPTRRGTFPTLNERTSVRMDFSHSAWSDIFFLGMDFPEGARVINASVDLAVVGRHPTPEPPIQCCLRVIDAPVLRLVSIDLDTAAEITDVGEIFDFGRDYLGLLKAAVIASGIIPPGLEGSGASVSEVLTRLAGPGRGLEVISRVNDIPKGSRLAVSTNLLGSLIALCMRATGQVSHLTGPLTESDRRLVAARAILGEWLGGSGGGWQDSGGVWPGIKLIEGATAQEGDPEYGISPGRLMPQHAVFDDSQISRETRQQLQDSLVLAHGGMAQNVGPILEMVTEKYLLRSENEWKARKHAVCLLGEIQEALQQGDIGRVGEATHSSFHGPLQDIIPWCSNAYTSELVERCQQHFGPQFRGFWMLGGMAGGGMGFIFDPVIRDAAQSWLQETMLAVKRSMESTVPFAMDPVVYDFAINDRGTWAELSDDGELPSGYLALTVPSLLRKNLSSLSPMVQRDLERAGDLCRESANSTLAQQLLLRILPSSPATDAQTGTIDELLMTNGFNRDAHEAIRQDILSGRLGLSQNRLSSTVEIEDVHDGDVVDVRSIMSSAAVQAGNDALRRGEAAVMTLAAGVGSRWTQGAGVVKALNPFCRMNGRYRSFLDIHLAKSNHTEQHYGTRPPHVVTTGYLTDSPIRHHVESLSTADSIYISRGASVGLRMIPTIRDLQFAWEEMPQQVLDEQQQKMRNSTRAALMSWAKNMGEASDYTDNVPLQCLHPVGHWYEFPNLLLNGTLQRLLNDQPQLQYLMLHNVDTLGVSLDAGCLGQHIISDADLSFEVISRKLEDRGGGLARVDGKVRLLEGLALPREEDEFLLSWYNTLTTWITIDRLLAIFELTRNDLVDLSRVQSAVQRVAARMPTYITLKDVKKRWGRGQEDIYPVAQFEKLWGDMTGLSGTTCQFLVVPSMRGQQLKDPAQLDGWLRDGSAAHVESLCQWPQV